MSDLTFLFSPIHIWLGNFITSEQVAESNRVKQIKGIHQRLLYPYTRQGRYGFQQLYSVEQQAFCQMLAHQGCIASALLFGFSLSADYRVSRRVICIQNAYQYAFLGMEGLLECSEESGFLEAIEHFLVSPVLIQICTFLTEKSQQFGPVEHESHPVIQCCRALMQTAEATEQLH